MGMINFAATPEEKVLAFIDAVVTIRERIHAGHEYAGGFTPEGRIEVWCETCDVLLAHYTMGAQA